MPYDIHLVSLHGGPVRSSSGVSVFTATLPPAARLRQATLLVAGGQDMPGVLAESSLIAWVSAAAREVGRCASVCSGAFILAEAGVLAQKRAVTHWKDSEHLRRQYPDVQVQDDAIYIRDGTVYTSAGITAGIDLCLSLVEEDLGRSVALGVAKRLVMYHKRPGGQRQFSSELLAQSGDGKVAGKLIQWLRPRIQEQISVDRMSETVGLSARSLHRHLAQELGVTPAQLLMRIRMEAACKFLEAGPHSIKDVARKSGFGTEYNLRRSFAKHLGVLPTEYRERFG